MIRWNWIERWALYSPDKIAIREYETQRAFTYADVHRTAIHLMQWCVEVLRGRGIIQTMHDLKGMRIALYAENCAEHFMLFALAQRTGCILVPLNYRAAQPEIEHYLHDVEPALVIVESKYRTTVESCPSAHTACVVALEDVRTMIDAWCAHHATTRIATNVFQAEILEEDPCLILYTGGSTGIPKGVMYSHGMVLWNSINTSLRLNLTADDHTVMCLPLFHTSGFNVLSTPFLHHGASLLLMKQFNANVVLRLLVEERVTLFMGVPTVLKMMAQSDAFAEMHLPHLRYFIVGGEPMPIPLIEQWQDGKGVAIRQGFGMTESGPNLFSLPEHEAKRKIGSIGFPNLYVETRIVDDAGHDVPQGESGELWVRGPMNTKGYWRNPEATQSALHDGWLATGDMMRQDEEGFFYVVDRKKNMYISGGENVYPAEVERALIQYPVVRECAVIAMPDVQWGETGCAFVVTHADVECTQSQVIEFLVQRIAKFKCPKAVVFLSELPKNDAGKIDRRALRLLCPKT